MDIDTIYMIEELVLGGTAMDDVLHSDPLPPDQWRPVFTGMLLGIEELHRNQIAHRDIKVRGVRAPLLQQALATPSRRASSY